MYNTYNMRLTLELRFTPRGSYKKYDSRNAAAEAEYIVEKILQQKWVTDDTTMGPYIETWIDVPEGV